MHFDPQCFTNHMGLYAIYPKWLKEAVDHLKAGTWPIVRAASNEDPEMRNVGAVIDGNVGIIPLSGPMMKGDSKFGGANSVRVRQAIRRMADDSDIGGIILHVDSPGGTVAGTGELATDVREANKRKPVVAFGDDLVASAAYWVAAQTDRIIATETTEVGSIGVLAVVHDTSGAAEMEGVKVHVVSTGDFKGAFTPGTEVTDDQLSELQSQVNDIDAIFKRDVARGRRMGIEQVRRVADGSVTIASKAKASGLIDDVGNFDDAMRVLRSLIRARKQEAEAKESRRAARARAEALTMEVPGL